MDDTIRKRIEAEAAKRGADPKAAVAEAERLAAVLKPETTAPDAKPESGGKPVADRLLVGFLPFITVRELRSEWLGLQDRIPDDGMTCGDYQVKHGGAAAGGTPEPQ